MLRQQGVIFREFIKKELSQVQHVLQVLVDPLKFFGSACPARAENVALLPDVHSMVRQQCLPSMAKSVRSPWWWNKIRKRNMQPTTCMA